jgi:uncharacterized membrane protein
MILMATSISVAICTSYLLWHIFAYRVVLQIIAILTISALGEHIVSGKGYYHYTERNGVFIGRVPIWIPFMWVSVVQSAALFALYLGAAGVDIILISGFLTFIGDFVLLEPLFSKQLGFWNWTPVENGYFSWIPDSLNKFTAPIGNYLVWIVFPLLTNAILDPLNLVL